MFNYIILIGVGISRVVSEFWPSDTPPEEAQNEAQPIENNFPNESEYIEASQDNSLNASRGLLLGNEGLLVTSILGGAFAIASIIGSKGSGSATTTSGETEVDPNAEAMERILRDVRSKLFGPAEGTSEITPVISLISRILHDKCSVAVRLVANDTLALMTRNFRTEYAILRVVGEPIQRANMRPVIDGLAFDTHNFFATPRHIEVFFNALHEGRFEILPSTTPISRNQVHAAGILELLNQAFVENLRKQYHETEEINRTSVIQYDKARASFAYQNLMAQIELSDRSAANRQVNQLNANIRFMMRSVLRIIRGPLSENSARTLINTGQTAYSLIENFRSRNINVDGISSEYDRVLALFSETIQREMRQLVELRDPNEVSPQQAEEQARRAAVIAQQANLSRLTESVGNSVAELNEMRVEIIRRGGGHEFVDYQEAVNELKGTLRQLRAALREPMPAEARSEIQTIVDRTQEVIDSSRSERELRSNSRQLFSTIQNITARLSRAQGLFRNIWEPVSGTAEAETPRSGGRSGGGSRSEMRVVDIEHNLRIGLDGTAAIETTERVGISDRPFGQTSRSSVLTPMGFLGGTAMNAIIIGLSNLAGYGYDRFVDYAGWDRSSTSVAVGHHAACFSPIAGAVALAFRAGRAHGWSAVRGLPQGMLSFMIIDQGVRFSQELIGLNSQSIFNRVSGVLASSGLAVLATHATVMVGGEAVSAAGLGLTLGGAAISIATATVAAVSLVGGVLLGLGLDPLSGRVYRWASNAISGMGEDNRDWMGLDGTFSDFAAAVSTRLINGTGESVSNRSARDIDDDDAVTYIASENRYVDSWGVTCDSEGRWLLGQYWNEYQRVNNIMQRSIIGWLGL
ncbi:MAG: hypothetical protein ABH859_01260 [Pseudomonadota bacterium]